MFKTLLLAAFGMQMHAQHFQEQTAQSFQGAFYGDCATMDIDNNDFPDLIFSGAVPGYATGHTAVYVNTDGVLSSIENEFSQIMFSAIGLGDIDSNGYQDFAITGTRVEAGVTQSNVFEIYYNNGDNTFTKDDDTGISYTNYGSVEVADLNDDGMPDIFVNGLSNNVYISKVYFQEEGGTFQESSISFMGTYFSDSKIFDANGDGLNDILITGFNTSYVPDAVLYINQGNGEFEIQESGIGGVYFSSLSLADFDNDGDIDILVSGMDDAYSASLVLYLNDGTGLFTPSTSTFSGVYSGSCALVDYNNDGFLDVFAIGSDGNQNKVKLYQNQNNTSFVEDTQNAAILTGLNMSSATWLDFDNDNDQDLFIMGYNVDNVAQSILYENTIELVNDDYCEVSVDFDVEPITSVEIANLTNATSAAIDGTSAYEDFTDLVADLAQGQTYTLTVKGNTNGNFEHDIRVFMDWNNDYLFDMDTEYYTASLQPSTGEDDVEVSIEITVPADANLGNTRMRITKDMWNVYEDGEFDACTNAYYGQVEDYTINIIQEDSVDCDNTLPGETPGDTGCVTFTYGGELVTYTTVRGADGNVWIQQNLGSESVGASATDVLAFGDLFQWGRWDDGHQSRTSTAVYQLLSPNNPTGLGGGNNSFYLTDPEWWNSGDINDTWNAETPQDITENDGCDPCKALGEGWEVPTQAEWQTIIAAEEMDDIQSAYNSNLKLVVAGARGTSGVYNDGVRGYYWSKTISEDNSQFAKYLYYSNFIVNPNSGGFREQGSSVRCIYKQSLQEEISVEITTENNATAEITTADGALQLVATVTPTDASQEVTWTIESGDEFVSVDDNGLVTAIANGVATIRATSTEDNTVFDEIDVTVDIETADECESVETFLETFETFTEFPSQCWNANYTNYALSISDETVQLYSGGATDEIIIVSPEVSTIDGQHVLAFDMVSITQPGTMLQVGTMTDNTDFTTFTAVGDSFAPVGGTTHTTATIPANEGHKYVAIRYTFPANSHIVLKLDNIEWKVAASNGRFDQNRVKIYPNPTSGLFYIDTDIAVRNIEVYNAMGQKVASTQHKEVDLSNVARGAYIVRVYATDGTFAAYKVVKK